MTTSLSGWGRFPRIDCQVLRPRTAEELLSLLKSERLIARGNGRAYGDAAMNRQATIDMCGFNHFLEFDEDNGVMAAEAGVLLSDIIACALPKGWFPSVTPGTKYVTLGGMIAADVHGKNHHKDGSFSHCIQWLDVVTQDGVIHRCSREQNPELFHWTIGGMGLTGIILRAAFTLTRVETAWIRQKSLAAENLDAVIKAFEETLDWTYSVAWIDCLAKGKSLGRSILMLGEHAKKAELNRSQVPQPFHTQPKRKITMPVNAPAWALNNWAMTCANTLYFHKNKTPKETLVDWDSYFYPLDAVLEWNKIYGKKGFAQFQCMLPLKSSRDGLQKLLEATSQAGQGSFLAVLKRFGKQDSKFSFPDEGYTLALDFPINEKSLALMKELDQITIDHGGRFYLAKDARLDAARFERSDPRIKDFQDMRHTTKSHMKFQSEQSERLGL